ncbi:MAG: pilus (MSHA type) biogenesis protein MshL [Hydrogenophilales bacterium]|nr:pilus (MSHA type) biogenesis protein MshL [Hydrogenophilales bacterium]
MLNAASSTLFRYASLGALIALGGCAQEPRIAQSQGHISQTPPAQAASAIPAPVQVPTQLPPPKVQAKPLTYNVVVTEVPAKELLFSLARDTKLNIDVHPNIQGVVTLNAINETLPAILDRIANQVNLRYKLEGNTLIVTPDSPFLKSYQVNYVNLSRKTTSSIGVATQVATTGVATGGSGGGASGAGNNSSSTTVASTSNNEFWEVLTANIRDILKSTRSVSQTAEDKNARVESARASREERLQQASAVARAGQSAPQLFNSIFGKQGDVFAEAKDEVIVNPSAGAVLVMATEVQHKIINQYIDSVMLSANRQVLIEATIVEVTLKDQFRAGIDWTRLVALGAGATGFSFTPATNLAGSLTAFQTLTYQNANDNFKAAIKLLDSFGEARVLSSPKLLVLNNQTSMLKVVDNLVYFSVEVTPGSTTGTTITAATYSTTAHTVPVGVIMAVTPQINESGRVTLVVRPTISRKNGEVSDPNPALTTVTNKVPIIQVREMESVLQVPSGETIVLGGLMQDDSSKNRDGLPGLTDNPVTNVLFGTRDRNVTQTELVIFLRPTVITNPSLSSDELSFYKRYLPKADAKP